MTPPPTTVAQIQERFDVRPLPLGVAEGVERQQTTLAEAVSLSGVGLHSGAEVNMTIKPAMADIGILFIRTDAPSMEEGLISALFSRVCDVTLSSRISNVHGYSIGTVEHLMAAFAGLGIDNAVVEIDGAEVPIMDGSSKVFVEALTRVGVSVLDAPRRYLRITQPIRVENGDSYCELLPYDGQRFEAVIEFDHETIGHQEYAFDLAETNFGREVGDARTFCLLKQVEEMHRMGLALGGSLENAVVVDDQGVVNEEGLRSTDEFVRHKLLDAVGDLYLAGLPIIGCYRGFKAGHALHNKLLNALFMEPEHFELVSPNAVMMAAE